MMKPIIRETFNGGFSMRRIILLGLFYCTISDGSSGHHDNRKSLTSGLVSRLKASDASMSIGTSGQNVRKNDSSPNSGEMERYLETVYRSQPNLQSIAQSEPTLTKKSARDCGCQCTIQ